jgi:hypothetical protein
MSSLWTIESPGLLEAKSFASLGLCNPRISKHSQKADTATFVAEGTPFDAPFLVPWDSVCVIRKDGHAWFSGRLTKPLPGAAGNAEQIEYELSGPWYDLEQVVYMQVAMFFNGTSTEADYTPMLTLGFEGSAVATNFLRITTGQQITNILQYAKDAGANLKIGFIDLGLIFPTSDVRGETCARLIQTVMQFTPDATLWFDHTTTPPTANLTRRAA